MCRLWDVRTSKCVAVTNTSSGLYVTWCPDGSSYAVMNSDNVLSVMDVRKAGKIVRSHKFPMEVCAGASRVRARLCARLRAPPCSLFTLLKWGVGMGVLAHVMAGSSGHMLLLSNERGDKEEKLDSVCV